MARDPRFRRTGVLGTWRTLKTSGRVTILDDTLTSPEFTDAVSRIAGMPAEQRVRDRKSLGEIMVLAHASLSRSAARACARARSDMTTVTALTAEFTDSIRWRWARITSTLEVCPDRIARASSVALISQSASAVVDNCDLLDPV